MIISKIDTLNLKEFLPNLTMKTLDEKTKEEEKERGEEEVINLTELELVPMKIQFSWVMLVNNKIKKTKT